VGKDGMWGDTDGGIPRDGGARVCWMGGHGGCERTCSILRCAPLLTK